MSVLIKIADWLARTRRSRICWILLGILIMLADWWARVSMEQDWLDSFIGLKKMVIGGQGKARSRIGWILLGVLIILVDWLAMVSLEQDWLDPYVCSNNAG